MAADFIEDSIHVIDEADFSFIYRVSSSLRHVHGFREKGKLFFLVSDDRKSIEDVDSVVEQFQV